MDVTNSILILFLGVLYSAKKSVEDCPPGCEEVLYQVSETTVPASVYGTVTQFQVFFKEKSLAKYKRDELYTFEDIICNILLLSIPPVIN